MRYTTRTLINGIRKGTAHTRRYDGAFFWKNKAGVECSLSCTMGAVRLYTWSGLQITSSITLPDWSDEDEKAVERAFLKKMLGL